jgi:hypothetical protein
MTLIVATYVPDGIVMTSDSRQFLGIKGKTPDGKDFSFDTQGSDFVNKTILIKERLIGISYFGQDLFGGISMASHIRKFVEEEVMEKDDITTIPEKLISFFRRSYPDADSGFHIAGFKKEGKISIPYVYHCHIKQNIIQRKNIDVNNSVVYGSLWSGQNDIIVSLVNPVVIKDEKGTDKIVRPVGGEIFWGTMTIQDAIDFSIYAIRTTIDTMRFQGRHKTVGGPIDVLLITPESARWIQEKKLRGEL